MRRLGVFLFLLLLRETELALDWFCACDFGVDGDDAFFLRGVEDQVAMLARCGSTEPAAPVIGNADEAGIGQLEVTLLRTNGVKDCTHRPARSVVWHWLVRAVGVHDRMVGCPREIFFDA